MKVFYLDIRAYHTLELTHHVCISEAGHSVTKRNSRVRYYITLNKEQTYWIYYRFSKIKNDVGEYEMSKEYSQCLVRANFDQVSQYNTD